jgi:hypothetical protein
MQLTLIILGAACLIWAISPVAAMVYGGASKDEVALRERQVATGQSIGAVSWLFRNRMLLGWLGAVLLLFASLV